MPGDATPIKCNFYSLGFCKKSGVHGSHGGEVGCCGPALECKVRGGGVDFYFTMRHIIPSICSTAITFTAWSFLK